MLGLGKPFTVSFSQPYNPSTQHSLWYGGRVAEVKYSGYTFILGAYGDVIGTLLSESGEELAYVKDKGNNGVFREEMMEFIPDDRSLRAIEMTEEGKQLVLENNNWWEVLIDGKDGMQYDLGWVCNSDYLGEALIEVIENMDEVIAQIEGRNA